MKRCFSLLSPLFWALAMLFAPKASAQVCDNLAIEFDGDADYISLNTSGTPINGDANFTFECWFEIKSSVSAVCTTNFRRLFILSGTSAPGSRFEVGECGHVLKLFALATNGSVIPVQNISAQLSPGCHHIAVVRNGAAISVYLDGATAPIYTGALGGPLNTNLFRVGHWQGGATPMQDWEGFVDEVRLWSTVRTPQQIKDYKDCTLSGTSTGLVVNWTFDQGPAVTPGGNNLGSAALDMSGNGNNGAFSDPNAPVPVPGGFALNGSASNFVCNNCPSRYQVDISDQVSQFPVLYASLCEGEKAHFCVSDNGLATTPPAGATVIWESSDNGNPFVPDPDLSNYAPAANAFCFPVKKGVLTSSDCATVGVGYTDRKYRVKIQKTMGTETCTSYSALTSLQICCKPTGGNITIVPNIQPPWCEGNQVSMTVFLQPSDPWLAFGPNKTIDWCLIDDNGTTPLPQYQNQLSFNFFPFSVGTKDICIEAKISHCSCPGITVKKCFDVDPQPMCGTIDLQQPIVFPITPIAPFQYEICPGNDAVLEMLVPTDFKNCTPVWQYHFGPPAPAPNSPNWQNLGSTNNTQQTNTLPQPNPLMPGLWPLGAKTIYYRIECRPNSWPNSGCDPCYSNLVEIQLTPPPPSGSISGPTQYCPGGPFPTLTVNPDVPGNWQYAWFWNGQLQVAGPSNTYQVTMPGCYWVGISNGCQTEMVGPHCVEECIIKPIIKCPTDNPCACDGQPITLDGCDSEDSCNAGPLTYSWLALPSGATGTGCTFTHTPDPNGETYILTVTNALGCSKTSKPLFIKPCN